MIPDPVRDHIEQARRLAIAERAARELQLENKVLRHIAGRPWYWHLGCVLTTLAERGVEAARRRLDGGDS